MLALSGLAPVPAMGDEGGGTEGTGGEPSEVTDPYEAYGDIGCAVVDGFNDRCPSMVSEPQAPRAGEFSGRDLLEVSPDGSMLYAIGQRDDGATYFETIITAVRAAPGNVGTDGTVAWSRSFGGSAELPQPQALRSALSNDGSRLFLAGQSWINSNQTLVGVQNSWAAAFDTANGDTIWARQLPAPADSRASQPGAVVVSPDDSRVFVSAGISHHDSIPNQETWHFALNPSTGEVEWQADYRAHNPNWPNVFTGQTMAVSPDGSRLFAQVALQRQEGPALLNAGNATLAFDTASGDLVWERRYLYPPEDGAQSLPWGLILTPDGRRVFATAAHQFNGGFDGARFRLFAYDTADGEPLWSREYSGNTGTGCDQENFVTFSVYAQRTLAVGPSGNVVYLVGDADYRHPDASDGGCSSRSGASASRPGTVVLAVDAESGALRWEEHFGQDGGWSCYNACNIAVASGPGTDDAAGQLLLTNQYLADDAGSSYPWTLAIDPTSGALAWQGRYLDTYNDGGTLLRTGGGGTVSPDGSRLYRLVQESSPTRRWKGVQQVLGYDLRRDLPDLIPITLTVSKGQQGYQRVLTIAVANDGPADAAGVVVRFFNGDQVVGESEPVTIKAGGRVSASYIWDTRGVNKPYQISAVVNPDQAVTESDYDNNRIQQQ